MITNNSSKKHKHTLSILMLDIQKHILKGCIAKEENYMTLLFNKKDDSIVFIHKNLPKQHLVTSNVDSMICTLSIVDNQKPDGDIISISLNDKIIEALAISKEITAQNIKLISGKNKIIVTAIDEGSIPSYTVHNIIKQNDIILLDMTIFLKKGEQKTLWFDYPKR
ncbi:MAG: hypothetical protein ACRC0A_06680 [Chitinophagaceae bacterium]